MAGTVKMIDPYEPRRFDRTIFQRGTSGSEQLAKKSPRIARVLAYLHSSCQAEKIRNVVKGTFPGMSFKHIESPIAFAILQDKDAPTVLFVDDRTIRDINREDILSRYPNTKIILVSSNTGVCTTPFQDLVGVFPDVAKADFIAAMAGLECVDFEKTIHAFIRLSEDSMSIAIPSLTTKRFTVLVVDDEPRWFVEFLPKLYSIIGRRADIAIARTFEEATEFFKRHGRHVTCLITDMFFPKNGILTDDAGKELVLTVNRVYPHTAIAIASKAGSGRELEDMALVLSKGDSGAIDELHGFMQNYAGFGDFIIKVNDCETSASSIIELRNLVGISDIEDIERLAEHENFSTWLYMHGFYECGNEVKKIKLKGENLRSALEHELASEISRLEKDPFVIADGSGMELCNTHSLREIQNAIKTLPPEMLEKWEEDDYLSLWLMRHGYTQLADELRSMQGSGEDVRIKVMAAFDRWIPHYERETSIDS